MSIAKTIVDKHGGQIGFATELGVGTTFFVDLAEWHIEQPIINPIPQLPKQSRILVCEDDPDVATLLTMMLRHAGFVVDVAHDAAQVRWLVARTHYDGMTLDLLLPDQDGLGLICELRAQPATQHMPIVVVSAHADEERAALKGDALEIVDWLNKPSSKIA